MMRPAQGMWTARFDEKRGDHVHGALDIAPVSYEAMKESERDLFALEKGDLYAHEIVLQTDDRAKWNAFGKIKWPGRPLEDYPFANYSVEYYGVCLALVTAERTYLYAHLNAVPHFLHRELEVFEKESNSRWVKAMIYGPERVEVGEYVGQMGWFGQTGPEDRRGMHLHIEAHRGRRWTPHGERIKLEDELRGIR